MSVNPGSQPRGVPWRSAVPAAAAARVRARPPSPAARGLTVLTAGRAPEPEVLARLEEIAALPFVEGVLALPDLHQKGNAEVPSSLAITTRDAIVPEFTSVAVNDGMGVVATGLEAREVTPDRAVALFARINAHAAAHVLDANRYSLSPEDMLQAAYEGGPAGVRRYGHDPAVLWRMESSGRWPAPREDGLGEPRLPLPLRASAVGRSEMGLNFGGNHFLELQVVDAVLDAEAAQRWGLAPGQVVLMYHLGPGPFASVLLHHYTRRRSLHGLRGPVYLLSKLLFHYGPGALRGAPGRKWQLHFRRNGWTAFPSDAIEGRVLRQAIAMASNFGYVYRLATLAAIRDALREQFSPRLDVDLVCDVAHNSLLEEQRNGATTWVARHNACRAVPGAAAILAGLHDVPSYLGVGLGTGGGHLHSYDHGAGHVIELWREDGRLPRADGSVVRVRMSRGRRGRVLARDLLPLRAAGPVEHVMACLERHGVVRPAVRLRPLATLKN